MPVVKAAVPLVALRVERVLERRAFGISLAILDIDTVRPGVVRRKHKVC